MRREGRLQILRIGRIHSLYDDVLAEFDTELHGRRHPADG
jgi:hypothetical protein